jgi:UDP-3-O-[3-hydroxymyristoyl] N-acetylglucosamine deacetylase
MTIKPAEADKGIIFCRKDLSKNNTIKAKVTNVSDTTLATTIGSNGTRVATVEHLMSAFYGAGIDNAYIEIDSFEVPIMDGSALPFTCMLRDAGREVQDKPRKYMVIKQPISVSDKEGEARLTPSKEFQITYNIDFDHPLIGQQSYHMVFSRDTYEKEISQARTFGFLREVEYLQAKGLALGGSLKNAIVLDDERIINKEGLRTEDEFVKHKILDAIGDLFLLGMPIIGHFWAYKSGHYLNNLLLRTLLSRKDCWEIVQFPHAEERKEHSSTSFFQGIPAIL